MRFNGLQRNVLGIAQRMLTQLRELEHDKIVKRYYCAGNAISFKYEPTKRGFPSYQCL